MANPKQASNKEEVKPGLVIEDSVAPAADPVKPVKTETKEVNGITMTFEDY